MAEPIRACPACGSAAGAEPGFLEDNGESSQGYLRWIAGPLERGWTGGAKRMGKQRWVVDTTRCVTCGYLALFASRQI